MGRNKAFEKQEIIEKAKNIFWKTGFEATSMQELVDGLSISRSSIYDTFGDKEKLYMETLKCYCQENAYATYEKSKGTKDEAAFIEMFFDNLVQQAKMDTEKKGCFLVNAIVEFSSENTTVNEIIESNNAVLEKMFEELLSKLQQKNKLAPEKSPKNLAKFLLNTIIGIRVYAKTYATGEELENIKTIALEAVLNH